MYDSILASLFFIVVLSPLIINAWLNWAETVPFRHAPEAAACGMNVGAEFIPD